MSLAGGFGARNAIIFLGAFNIAIILVAAIINNFFPTVPFASIITAYTNLFLTTVLLFLAGTFGFAQIIINVVFQILWVGLNFLWVGLSLGEIPDLLSVAPSFDFSGLTRLFVGLFQGIIGQPLLFSAVAPDSQVPSTVSFAIGGAEAAAAALLRQQRIDRLIESQHPMATQVITPPGEFTPSAQAIAQQEALGDDFVVLLLDGHEVVARLPP